MQQTYYIEASRQEQNEYRIECSQFASEEEQHDVLPAYQRMVDWMKGQLLESPDGKARVHKLTPEYNPERDMNIISHETTRTGVNYRVIPDKEIILDADRPFEEIRPATHFQAKGYDLGEQAYFFASVDTWRTVKPYKADSPEQALQMAKGEQLHNVLTRAEPVRQLLHADKFHRVTLESGQTVDIVSDDELQQKLREKFPDGMTVRLADESYANLLNFQDYDYLKDYNDWLGLANPGNDTLLVANGPIPVELHLQPEDYKDVFACEDTYFDRQLTDLLNDESLTAPSLLLAGENEMESFRVKVPQLPELKNRLFIAGRPFEDVMALAESNDVQDDRSFMHMLDKQYLAEQPDWIQQLAHKQTMQERHKSFINLTARPVAEYNSAYARLLDEAATRFGCGPAERLKGNMDNPSGVPNEQKEKVYQAAAFINKEMQPYEKAQNEAFERYRHTVTNQEAGFARRFNDFIKNRVKDVTMYPNTQGKWNVRCKIDGEQQMGLQIDDKDARIRRDANGNFKSIKLMACKYYQDEILSTMNAGQEQERTKSIKR